MTKPGDILTKIKNNVQVMKKAIKTIKRPDILKSCIFKMFSLSEILRTRIVRILMVLVLFIGGSLLLLKVIEPFNIDHIARDTSNNTNANESSPNSHQLRDIEDLIIHKTIKSKINGLEQVINILEVDVSTNQVKVKPVLSHGSVYGFELLSEMVEKHKAYAAINAGFFYEYGEPSGMVITDGEIITGSTGQYPIFTINNGKAALQQFETELYLYIENSSFDDVEKSNYDDTEKANYGNAEKQPQEENHLQATKADNLSTSFLRLDKINVAGKPGEWVLYTRRYGTDNRVKQDNITIIIENNIIKEIIEPGKETQIPEKGMLATYIKPSGQNSILPGEVTIPFAKGEKVKFEYKPYLGTDGQAYECGSWIIRDGEIVIGERDPWVGVLTNRDPRTAIGIKEDGEVVLITVDGRQPGYSYGFTARELGEFLLEYGVKDAAMLDGGASTEMIINGEVVNRPSFRASERPLAGAIVVMVK
jgi:exopolysaccharide biosynthesis protein